MKKIINGAIMCAAFFIAAACNQPAKQQQETAKADTVSTANAQIVDTNNTGAAFSAYIDLKNEFLKSDVDGIKKAAANLETKLAAIKGCSETATLAHEISTASDVAVQRGAFLILSKDIISLVKGAKFKTAPIYVDFCPMADGGKGGYWLSSTKTIENPYFPEHMKTCGQVKEQIN